MTTQLEIINGHKYWVTRDDQGGIVEKIACDDTPVQTPPPILAKARLILAVPVPFTAEVRDRAIKLILALLLKEQDLA